MRFSTTDDSVSDELCFSVGTRGSNSAHILPRSVYSTNSLADFGACNLDEANKITVYFREEVAYFVELRALMCTD